MRAVAPLAKRLAEGWFDVRRQLRWRRCVQGEMLESLGLTTTVIGLVRPHIEKSANPRGLFVPFPLGRPLGEPGDAAFPAPGAAGRARAAVARRRPGDPGGFPGRRAVSGRRAEMAPCSGHAAADLAGQSVRMGSRSGHRNRAGAPVVSGGSLQPFNWGSPLALRISPPAHCSQGPHGRCQMQGQPDLLRWPHAHRTHLSPCLGRA